MRARSRREVGLSKVQYGWEAPGCDAAPASATSATRAGGKDLTGRSIRALAAVEVK
jgi:hypothetical protein